MNRSCQCDIKHWRKSCAGCVQPVWSAGNVFLVSSVGKHKLKREARENMQLAKSSARKDLHQVRSAGNIAWSRSKGQNMRIFWDRADSYFPLGVVWVKPGQFTILISTTKRSSTCTLELSLAQKQKKKTINYFDRWAAGLKIHSLCTRTHCRLALGEIYPR